MFNFDELSETEKNELLKFPVYLCLLAANTDDFFDEGKDTTVSFGHLKTYTSDPALKVFYENAYRVFQTNLELLDNQLPKGKLERAVAIKVQLRKIKELLRKFEPDSAILVHQSMKAFKEHVSAAHEDVLDDFLFPIPIKGLTDQ